MLTPLDRQLFAEGVVMLAFADLIDQLQGGYSFRESSASKCRISGLMQASATMTE
jgi:hypothetical protein